MKTESIKMENNHCCKRMNAILESNRYHIEYYSAMRSYFIPDKHNPCAVDLEYCPWCGKKLPADVVEEREKILEQEYGLTNTWKGGKDYDKIPPEFHTDEWWKKRGL